jgi:TolB-like protein/Tfp pilus assembly protein PilF
MAVLYVIAAWLIMQVAEVVIGLVNLPDWIGPTILTLLAIGFPISLIFSWFYELTPEGISLEKDVDRAESITRVTGRRLDFIVISLLCAAVILFAYDKWWTGPPPEKSIAVLPFTNMSADPDQEYFSDGISEEILNVLAKIPDLHVTSRSSAFTFKGKDVDIPTVAEQLGVANILEGSVRKSGNRIRIAAQLIEARTDKHLWSETYDRDLEDIFAVQDEISTAIVMALQEHLGLQVEAVPRVIAAANTEAHDAYLRGRYLVVQRTQGTIEGAVREFEKAISLDPDYALAHAELAIATLLLDSWGGYGDLTVTEARARASPHAERAMALDPTLAEAHAAAGFLVFDGAHLQEALTHFRQAIQINPNYSIVYTWMANILGSDLGQYAEAFRMRETALRLDPLSIPGIATYIGALIARDRLAEADRELEKLAVFAPQYYASVRGKRTSLGGKWANRVLGMLDAIRIDPADAPFSPSWNLAILGLEREALAASDSGAFELAMLGRSADALAQLEALIVKDPKNVGIRKPLGLLLAANGDYARARPILEEHWHRSDGRVTDGLFGVYSAAALIAIRRDAGEEAGVSELVAAIRDNVRRYREAGIIGVVDRFLSADFEEGVADYYAGERERGLALIAKAAEDGVFIVPKGGLRLHGDPGFAAILARQEARQARERERFLAIVCNDNPYADFWRPLPETCEGVEELQKL